MLLIASLINLTGWTLVSTLSWYTVIHGTPELIHTDTNFTSAAVSNASWSHYCVKDFKVTGDTRTAPSWSAPFTPLNPTGTWSATFYHSAGSYSIPAHKGFHWNLNFDYADGQEKWYNADESPVYATRNCTKYFFIEEVAVQFDCTGSPGDGDN